MGSGIERKNGSSPEATEKGKKPPAVAGYGDLTKEVFLGTGITREQLGNLGKGGPVKGGINNDIMH